MCLQPESLGQAVKAGFRGPWVKKTRVSPEKQISLSGKEEGKRRIH